jgi:hypothetical protein
MNILKIIFTNGYILILPILVWNLIFTSKLPLAYAPRSFNSNIPSFLLIGENIFRTIIFIFPFLFKININLTLTLTQGKQGLIVYLFGSLLYYASWLLLIYSPNSLWSKSLFGFAAPAYTPIIWFVGIALMVDSYYFKITYNKWHFILLCIIFSIFHVTHSVLAYLRSN